MCDLMNPGSCKVELEVEGGGEDRGLRTINEEGLSFSWIWPRLDCFKLSAVCLLHQEGI